MAISRYNNHYYGYYTIIIRLCKTIFDKIRRFCKFSSPAGMLKKTQKEVTHMQVKGFLLTLGVGMLAGGAAALMLPQQSELRKTAQKAVDSAQQSISELVNS